MLGACPKAMNDCRNCAHFRAAPYEAKKDACYHPEHMGAKQSARFLDEQQVPGNHRKINARGDCETYAARRAELPWYRRLLQLGA